MGWFHTSAALSKSAGIRQDYNFEIEEFSSFFILQLCLCDSVFFALGDCSNCDCFGVLTVYVSRVFGSISWGSLELVLPRLFCPQLVMKVNAKFVNWINLKSRILWFCAFTESVFEWNCSNPAQWYTLTKQVLTKRKIGSVDFGFALCMCMCMCSVLGIGWRSGITSRWKTEPRVRRTRNSNSKHRMHWWSRGESVYCYIPSGLSNLFISVWVI